MAGGNRRLVCSRLTLGAVSICLNNFLEWLSKLKHKIEWKRKKI
jgi:hypothetical protein